MKIQTIECTALFPHKNLMFELEKEQQELIRFLVQRRQLEIELEAPNMQQPSQLLDAQVPAKMLEAQPLNVQLPAKFCAPFCPVHKEVHTSSPIIGTLEAIDGFIMRPIRFNSDNQELQEAPIRVFPYPSFPAQLGFMYAYGGDNAKEILKDFNEHSQGFTEMNLRVWYFAKLRLDYGLIQGRSWYCSWQQGAPSWHKVALQF